MPAITRKTADPSAGHCYTPRPPDTGSEDVITENFPTARAPKSEALTGPWGSVPNGDHYPAHSCGSHSHDGYAAVGSPVVIVNGSPVHRIGDAISCGDISASGAATVFAGDSPMPSFVAVEPGVFLVGGAHVYDNSPAAEIAIAKSEPHVPPSGHDAPPQPEPAQPAEYAPCDRFLAVITLADMATQVSKYFKLSSCKNMPVAQRGLTAAQIACNWAALCLAILDPINEEFKISFNSGFRTVASGMGSTDHGLGCAADISAGSDTKTFAMYQWIIAHNLPYSQIIYEKKNTAWVHVSFNGKPQSAGTRQMWTLTGSAPYHHGIYTG